MAYVILLKKRVGGVQISSGELPIANTFEERQYDTKTSGAPVFHKVETDVLAGKCYTSAKFTGTCVRSRDQVLEYDISGHTVDFEGSMNRVDVPHFIPLVQSLPTEFVPGGTFNPRLHKFKVSVPALSLLSLYPGKLEIYVSVLVPHLTGFKRADLATTVVRVVYNLAYVKDRKPQIDVSTNMVVEVECDGKPKLIVAAHDANWCVGCTLDCGLPSQVVAERSDEENEEEKVDVRAKIVRKRETEEIFLQSLRKNLDVTESGAVVVEPESTVNNLGGEFNGIGSHRNVAAEYDMRMPAWKSDDKGRIVNPDPETSKQPGGVIKGERTGWTARGDGGIVKAQLELECEIEDVYFGFTPWNMYNSTNAQLGEESLVITNKTTRLITRLRWTVHQRSHVHFVYFSVSKKLFVHHHGKFVLVHAYIGPGLTVDSFDPGLICDVVGVGQAVVIAWPNDRDICAKSLLGSLIKLPKDHYYHPSLALRGGYVASNLAKPLSVKEAKRLQILDDLKRQDDKKKFDKAQRIAVERSRQEELRKAKEARKKEAKPVHLNIQRRQAPLEFRDQISKQQTMHLRMSNPQIGLQQPNPYVVFPPTRPLSSGVLRQDEIRLRESQLEWHEKSLDAFDIEGVPTPGDVKVDIDVKAGRNYGLDG